MTYYKTLIARGITIKFYSCWFTLTNWSCPIPVPIDRGSMSSTVLYYITSEIETIQTQVDSSSAEIIWACEIRYIHNHTLIYCTQGLTNNGWKKLEHKKDESIINMNSEQIIKVKIKFIQILGRHEYQILLTVEKNVI